MGGSGTAEPNVCANCGTPLTGLFCAQCGTRAADGGGWGVVASEFFNTQEPKGHASTLASFLKAPVDTIMRLTEDVAYRRHWSFLSLALAVQFALGFLILPHFLGQIYAVPDLGGKAAVITSQISQYLGIAILTPIQYYICRAVSTIPRKPASYVKLCVLSVSFCAIISTIAILLFWLIGPASAAGGQTVDPAQLGNVLTLISQIAILVFVTMAHKRFWGMKWWVAILVTLMIAFLSWGVVYPLVLQFVNWTGVVPLIDELLP